MINFCGGVVTITAQVHSTKPALRLCAGPKPVSGMLENLWKWSQLEIRLSAFVGQPYCKNNSPSSSSVTPLQCFLNSMENWWCYYLKMQFVSLLNLVPERIFVCCQTQWSNIFHRVYLALHNGSYHHCFP